MVRIISDSSTLFSTEGANKSGFDIAPLSVTINGKNYKEYDEVSSHDFIKKIYAGEIPKSSQPAVGDFLDLYNKYPDDEIIVITMSEGISGTYNSACLARNMSDNNKRITVVNSRTLCGPQRDMVLKAVSLAHNGSSKDHILSEINRQISATCSYLIPRDFDFLKRGGRLNPLVAELGKLINLIPVLKLSKDSKSLVSFTKQRTLSKAVNKIINDMKEYGVNHSYKIYIADADAKADAEIIKQLICRSFPHTCIESLDLSPVFITQGGPKCISVQAVLK